jgi:hypothetical protein
MSLHRRVCCEPDSSPWRNTHSRSADGGPVPSLLLFLVSSAAGVQPTAKKFGVSYDSLRNHAAKHISQTYRDAVRSGPLQSEEQLRRLVAESGVGVIENLKTIYSGLASRWLHAFEAGDDHKLSLLTGKLHANLELQGRITRELQPSGGTYVQNNFLLGDAAQLLKILAPFPEARKAIVDFYTEQTAVPRQVEHVAKAAD